MQPVISSVVLSARFVVLVVPPATFVEVAKKAGRILGRVHVDEWSDVDSKLLISLTEKSAMDFLTDFLLLFASNIAHRNETNETDTLIATLFDGHHFPGANSLRSVHYHFRHPRRSPLF